MQYLWGKHPVVFLNFDKVRIIYMTMHYFSHIDIFQENNLSWFQNNWADNCNHIYRNLFPESCYRQPVAEAITGFYEKTRVQYSKGHIILMNFCYVTYYKTFLKYLNMWWQRFYNQECTGCMSWGYNHIFVLVKHCYLGIECIKYRNFGFMLYNLDLLINNLYYYHIMMEK